MMMGYAMWVWVTLGILLIVALIVVIRESSQKMTQKFSKDVFDLGRESCR
jgi:heme exporter protein D